jgi:ActR/RegA family two-component response regulator
MSAASSASAFVGRVLIVSNNAVAVGQIKDSLQRFALFPEQCPKLSLALERLNRAKFEAVVIDLQLGSQAEVVLQAVRQAPSNKHAVVFTVSDNRADASGAFRAGSTFVLLRPLSRGLINLSFKAAYGLIVREKRRYFRCPVEVPVAILRTALPAVHGSTVNVSEGGMSIAANASLGSGDPVQLQFALPGDEFQFVVEAAVCWANQPQIGMRFTFFSPHLASRLQEWLSRQLEETIPQSVREQFSKLPKE